MGAVTDYFIRGSDNVISTTLTEDGTPIVVTWTEVTVGFETLRGGRSVLDITRSSETAGFTFQTGVLELTPADLTEDLSVLEDNNLYKIRITVKTAQEPSGVVYAGGDSDNRLFYHVSTA